MTALGPSNQTFSLPGGNSGAPNFVPTEFVEQEPNSETIVNTLNQSIAKLGKVRKSLQAQTKLEASEELDQSLDRVQSALMAVQDFSRQLEYRLHANKKTEHPTDNKIAADYPPHNDDNTQAQTNQDSHLGSDQSSDGFCFNGKGLAQSVIDFGLCLFAKPQIFLDHYHDFALQLLQIVQGKSDLAPERHDHRFRDNVWQDNVFYRALLQSYLAWGQQVEKLINDLPFTDENDRRRSQFLASQWIAACSPSNSLLNPSVIKRSFQTGGLSLVAGAQNFLHDVVKNNGLPRQVNPNAYQVGKDLAVTEGVVVLRTPVLELIQYRCSTSVVYQRPILIVPPQINKFYIFDLTPKNSIVQHLLQSGHAVFIVSWKNPSAADCTWNLQTYVKHLYQAVTAIAVISQCRDVNLVSGCAGGLTATTLQAYCRQLHQSDNTAPTIHSHSLLVTALSAKQHPLLGLFVNKNLVTFALTRAAQKGVMDGRELSQLFAWLRPVDLVWNFWVNNILLGKEPPAMEVLYWDNDSTRLPAGLHRDFIDIVVNDRFGKAENICINQQAINLQDIDSDFYFVAGDEDYLMPWKNCYRNFGLFPKAKCDFVLSNSGHIQSILRPPGIAKTYFYTNEHYANDADTWLADADKHEGSWWEHWAGWLASRGGELVEAPPALGNDRFPPLCPSPGTYVLE